MVLHKWTLGLALRGVFHHIEAFGICHAEPRAMAEVAGKWVTMAQQETRYF